MLGGLQSYGTVHIEVDVARIPTEHYPIHCLKIDLGCCLQVFT
jgi:hypothetical protein